MAKAEKAVAAKAAPKAGGKGPAAPKEAPAPPSRPKAAGKVPPRLFERFKKAVVPALMKERGYTNPFQVPRVEKIVINMGVGEGKENAKALDFATTDLIAITGQRPVITRAKKSIANFKLRAGVPIGAKVTLRGARMYEFSTGWSTWPCPGCATSGACRPRPSTAGATSRWASRSR